MAKGVPTARSQRYKATHNAKDTIISTPFKSSNDALPLLTSISEKPTTQAAGAQLAFSTVQVLHQALLHAASPGTHPYALLQVMAPYISDCSERHRESELRNLALQQQLDESNSKLLEQFMSKMQKFSNCKNSGRKVKRHKSFTANKLCKLIWFHLAVAVALFHQTLTSIFRPLRFIYQQLILARNDTIVPGAVTAPADSAHDHC